MGCSSSVLVAAASEMQIEVALQRCLMQCGLSLRPLLENSPDLGAGHVMEPQHLLIRTRISSCNESLRSSDPHPSAATLGGLQSQGFYIHPVLFRQWKRPVFPSVLLYLNHGFGCSNYCWTTISPYPFATDRKKKVGKEEDIKSSRCNTALSLLQHMPLWDCYSCM